MLIVIIVVCACANLLMTFVVGTLVNQLTINPQFLSAMKKIEELEKKLDERYK